MVALDTSDIQGFVLYAYKHLPCAAYALLRISDPGPARQWLARISDAVTSAAHKKNDYSLNVALTYTGLQRIELEPAALASFPYAFQDGMSSPYRARILGDTEDSAPDGWRWGGPGTHVDVLLLIFAADDMLLDQELERRRQEWLQHGLTAQCVLEAGRQTDTREHFGFVDGIGQPVIEGSGLKRHHKDRTGHATTIRSGEFLLGYANEYKKLPDTPTVTAATDYQSWLPPAAGGEARRRDLGRNGTYLVYRQLAQHVAQFWTFFDEATRRPDGSPDPQAREWLAAKCVGRWKSGVPLVLAPEGDPHAADGQPSSENNFEYHGQDPHGLACPIGAHIRRANPRDALGKDPKKALESARRHRILRRGRSFGDRSTNVFVDDGAERGLHFICLNADIERQFEFIQHTWINNSVFGGLHDEVDPIVGNQAGAAGYMTVQAYPLRQRVTHMRRFVTVLGGAYFFLPGIRALRYLASL